MRDDEIPRPVKPRRPQDSNLPIICIHRKRIYVERTDELTSLDRLPALIASEPASYVVAHNAGDVLATIHETFKDNERWQYKLTPVERDIRDDSGETIAVSKSVIVNFFGFRSQGKRVPSRYHYALDPLVFVRKSAPEIRGREVDTMTALFDWACDVRAFAVDNDLRLSPTSGGIAAQLLRDPRFYPEARRKVPAATNARARANLPGNFYRLEVETERFYSAVYLDQEAAHHSAARDLTFPHADRLFAKGNFTVTDVTDETHLWSRAGTRHFVKIIEQPGLFYLRLLVPRPKPGKQLPPYMETAGTVHAFVYSNELPMIQSLGGRIQGIHAAWTSTKVDNGLNTYATWALDQLHGQPKETKEWLKPTLLAPYGLLAAKPRALEFCFRQAKSGTLEMLPVGGSMLPAMCKRTERKLEPGFVNVIHRGMIEAETRKRTIELANSLVDTGLEVIAVYADAVFVLRNGPLPLLPQGWSVKSDLDALRFLNPVQFTSRQLTKLPGVPRELQERFMQSRGPISAATRRH